MSRSISVRNPRTGDNDFTIEATTGATIKALAEKTRPAQTDWLSLGLDGRIAVLQALKDALQRHRDSIVSALSADTGRHMLANQELDGLMRGIERWCQDAPALVQKPERPSKVMPHIAIQQRHDPYPLVGVISPWNFPLLLSFIDATPALLAGCAVIIKPSEVTPRFAAAVREAIAEVSALAPVLHFIDGDGETGSALIEHVDAVAFTGSVATGRKVAAAAAQRFIPAFLELGGKDPVILLEGSDLERAATAILRASVAATGQACQSLERIYVHRSQHDDLVALLTEKAAATPLSYPDPHEGIIGPLIFAQQAVIIESHLEEAQAGGAVIHTGGKIESLGGGLWIAPTVLSNVNHEMRIMRDETFGPVMPVMAFDTEDEAIGLANDSDYGLSAAVFGSTEKDALRVAEQIQAGGISVNDAGMTTMIFEEQKSAFRCSGMGPSRVGASGLTRFYRNKALFVNRGDVVPIEVMAE